MLLDAGTMIGAAPDALQKSLATGSICPFRRAGTAAWNQAPSCVPAGAVTPSMLPYTGRAPALPCAPLAVMSPSIGRDDRYFGVFRYVLAKTCR